MIITVSTYIGFIMCQARSRILYPDKLKLMKVLQLLSKVGTLITPIVEMMKLKHREVSTWPRLQSW